MKYGFVFECWIDGPDYKVIKHLVNKILPECVFRHATLGDKAKLLEECADSVELFLRSDCDKVFIVWDLIPKYDKCACIVHERDLIRHKLIDRNINLDNVEFIGIVHELESWLLADKSAVEVVLSTREHAVRLNAIRHPDRDTNPKGRLKKLFLEHKRFEYNDLDHAYKIIQKVDKVRNLRRSESFRRFFFKLKGEEL